MDHGLGSRMGGLVQMPGWPPVSCVALGQVLPLSELRFLGLQTGEWHWPLGAIISCSGKCPAQADVENRMAVHVLGEQVYAALGCRRQISVLFWAPALPLGAMEPQANHKIRILMALLQEANSAQVFYQHPKKALLK